MSIRPWLVRLGVKVQVERRSTCHSPPIRPPSPRAARTRRARYRAFLDPDAMAKWLPPHGFTGKVHQMDARVGGSYRMSFTNFGTGSSHSFGGTYVELTPHERIRYTDKFDDPNLPGEMQVTITFRTVSCGTELDDRAGGHPVRDPGRGLLPRLAGIAVAARAARRADDPGRGIEQHRSTKPCPPRAELRWRVRASRSIGTDGSPEVALASPGLLQRSVERRAEMRCRDEQRAAERRPTMSDFIQFKTTQGDIWLRPSAVIGVARETTRTSAMRLARWQGLQRRRLAQGRARRAGRELHVPSCLTLPGRPALSVRGVRAGTQPSP